MIRKNDYLKNSIKQLFRKKWMSILFFCIIMLGTVFFTLGCSLWMGVLDSINQMKDSFTTIGTVTQKPDSMVTERKWDAELQKYKITERASYTQILDEELLNSLDVTYINKVERRPFYGAVSPDFITGALTRDGAGSTSSLVEFSPLENSLPSSPVKVEIKNVYWGDGEPSMVGKEIWFCDHYREETEPLEAGKTYIAFLGMNIYGDTRIEEEYPLEYVPAAVFPDWNPSLRWQEVSAGFWNTEEGAVWQNLIDELNKLTFETVPVTPTENIELLSPFHDGQASIVEGEAISGDEYEDGSKVCLISQTFAKLNNLKVGDKVKLQMFFTDYENSNVLVASEGGGMSRLDILTPEGQKYDVFFESDYIIKGIYLYNSAGWNLYELVTDEIIIPSASVPEEKVRNVIAEGPMQGYNASFQIENGGINDFYKEFSKLPESSLLEITFDDKGYERFASQMNNMQTIAIIIFLVGFVSVVASSAFLLYSAIIKQRKRTAIERALGMSRRECRASLLTGIMLLTIIAACVGGTIGGIANEKMLNTASLEEDYFSSMYSKGIAGNKDEEMSIAVNQNIVRNSIVFAVSAEVLGVFAMSLFLIGRNLKVNPIQLLGVREEE